MDQQRGVVFTGWNVVCRSRLRVRIQGREEKRWQLPQRGSLRRVPGTDQTPDRSALYDNWLEKGTTFLIRDLGIIKTSLIISNQSLGFEGSLAS